MRLIDPTEEHRDSYWFGLDVRGKWSPSREERRTMYYGPLRRATRDTMRNAVKDYNTCGDVDEDFFLQGNHRHASYHGGDW